MSDEQRLDRGESIRLERKDPFEAELQRRLETEQVRRRSGVEEKARSSLPEFLRTIVHSMVRITMHPNLLPYHIVNHDSFLDLVKNRFRLQLGRQGLGLENLPVDTNTLTDNQLVGLQMKRISAGEDTHISFWKGRFPLGPGNRFAGVNAVAFSREQINVDVNDRSDIAEVIVAEMFEILWQSAGEAKVWNDPDVIKGIQAKGYVTCTKVNLGVAANELLDPKLAQFLKENIDAGEQFGPRMMRRTALDNFAPSNSSTNLWTFDHLVLKVHSQDKISGVGESSNIDFDVTARHEVGRGILDLETEMPFDDHVEFTRQLLAAVQGKPT